MKAIALACVSLVACYPGVDNSDCQIRCGEEAACPANLSCVGGFCVDEGQTCIDPGLVLAYSFDDIDNNAVADHSGNGNTGGIEGEPVLIDGVHGQAMSFDGMGDLLRARHSPSLAVAPAGAFTVSFWILVEPQQAFIADQIIVAKTVEEDQITPPFYEFGVEFDQADKLLELFVGDDANNIITAYKVTPPLGQFAHVAFTWDGSIVHGYLDGILQPFADNSLAVTIPDHEKNLVVGSQTTSNESFLGALDDLRIYNRALTIEEIVSDRDSGVAP